MYPSSGDNKFTVTLSSLQRCSCIFKKKNWTHSLFFHRVGVVHSARRGQRCRDLRRWQTQILLTFHSHCSSSPHNQLPPHICWSISEDFLQNRYKSSIFCLITLTQKLCHPAHALDKKGGEQTFCYLNHSKPNAIWLNMVYIV